MKLVAAVLLSTVGAVPVLADFSYQETIRITGGMAASAMRMAGVFSKQAREPIVSSVAVQGHRLVSTSRDHSRIVDLDKETITEIDQAKRAYTVMTFAQMREMLEKSLQQMQDSAKQRNADVDFKTSAKETGQTRNIAGRDAREMVMTITMQGTDQRSGQTGAMDLVSDVWIAAVPGYEEVRDFYRGMAGKIGYLPNGALGPMMQRPDMAKGLADLYKEMSKLQGMPVEQVVRMGPAGMVQPGSMAPAQQPRGPSAGEVAGAAASETAASKLGGKLGGLAGGLGGFGRRKKQEESRDAAAASGAAGESALLVEMTMEAGSFSTAPVDSSRFAVPAGFQQVEAGSMNRRQR